MTTDVRFTTHPSARPQLLQAPAAPAAPARQPLGYPAGGDYAQGLANSLDAIRRNPPRTKAALGEDLLAEALLRHAQRNSAEGQAATTAAGGIGGGGYGSGLSPLGGAPQPPDLPPGSAPIDPLKLHQGSQALAALLQGLAPQSGLSG
jgi:hypothetical protein